MNQPERDYWYSDPDESEPPAETCLGCLLPENHCCCGTL